MLVGVVSKVAGERRTTSKPKKKKTLHVQNLSSGPKPPVFLEPLPFPHFPSSPMDLEILRDSPGLVVVSHSKLGGVHREAIAVWHGTTHLHLTSESVERFSRR